MEKDDHAELETFHKWRPVYNLAAKGAEGKAEAAAWRYYGGADDLNHPQQSPGDPPLWRRLLTRLRVGSPDFTDDCFEQIPKPPRQRSLLGFRK